MTFTPSGDSYVDSSLPANNFGTANPLITSAGVRRALLKFNTSILAGDTISSVSLRLFSKATASSGGYEIHPQTDAWLESTVTWNNQPAWNATILQTSGVPVSGTWITIPLPVNALNTNGATNFGIRFSLSGFNALFSSREDVTNQPQLVVTYTLPQDPVLATVGDIMCGSLDAGLGYPCQGATTANIIRQMQPTNFLALGDNQYEQGSLSDYTTYFDPAWGFAKPITKPVPGNHEYGTAGGNGYYTYFGSAASPEEPGCTVNCKGYYSYDLGNWHLIALNTECGNITGGCATGSPEETWLQNDLSQVAPTKCILAYWHEGHFSSGNDGNTSETAVSFPFWQDLYAAGADVVLNGHSHNYERFAQQDPSGNATTAGMREFIVGTGGRDFTGWWTNSLANSQVKNNDTFGVLKLILHANSYDWQFVPANGIGYTNGTFTDSGSTACH
jgi:acid phosphatase type 7